jgi:hypothetical protein
MSSSSVVSKPHLARHSSMNGGLMPSPVCHTSLPPPAARAAPMVFPMSSPALGREPKSAAPCSGASVLAGSLAGVARPPCIRRLAGREPGAPTPGVRLHPSIVRLRSRDKRSGRASCRQGYRAARSGSTHRVRAGMCAIYRGLLAGRIRSQVREAGHGSARRRVERTVDLVVLLVYLRPVCIWLGDLLPQFHHGGRLVHISVGA